MSQFIFFAILLGLIAVAFAISALWQRSRALALALAIALPVVTWTIYHFKGEPAALDPANVATPATLEEAVTQLQQRVSKEPENFQSLVVLARSYMALGKFELARDTYAKALNLQPDESDLTVEYAESLLRTSADHRFPPTAVAMLEKAVAKNPGNQRALFFLGMQQMQDNQPAKAAATWETLLPLLSPETAVALHQQIDKARLAAGMPNLPEAAMPASAVLSIEVRLDPTLVKLAQAGDVLYVFARSADGNGPPIAVKRIALDKFPVKVELTDADSPMPAARLSTQKTVMLMARLSKSGDAKPASGDIEADAVEIEVAGKQPLTLVLNRPVP